MGEEELKDNVIPFNGGNTGVATPVQKELSYEELKQLAIQSQQQAEKFYKQLQQVNYSNVLTRMQMLFEVISQADKFKEDFVAKCAAEIESFLTLAKPEEEPA